MRDVARGRQIPAFDGIRGLAVGLVFIVHSDFGGSSFISGQLGVDFFFVLSGFLITRILLDDEADGAPGALRRFYRNRALRLLPALAALLIVGLLFSSALSGSLSGYLVTAILVATYTANIALAYVGEGRHVGVFSYTWTLSLEEQFYLVWPVTLRALRRRSRHVVPMVGLAALVSLALIEVPDTRTYVGFPVAYFRPDARAFGLLVGCLLALLSADPRYRRLVTVLASPAAEIAALVLLVLVFTDAQGRSVLGELRVDVPLVTIGAAVWVLICANRERSITAVLLSTPPLRALGRVSYGVYLYHLPIIVILRVHEPGWSRAERTAVAVAVTAAASVTSWMLLERPALRSKGARQSAHEAGTVAATRQF